MVHSREHGGTYLGPRQRSRRNIAIVRANDRGLLRNIALPGHVTVVRPKRNVRSEKERSAFRVYGAMSKTLRRTQRLADVCRNRLTVTS